MIHYDCLSRNVLEPKKYEEIKRRRLELKRLKDKKQLALKLVLNATYGILKDRNNPFYDPRMSNQVCVTGQLLLLDLVEKVEHLGETLQMNTDGVYMYVDNMENVEKIKEIAHEWEVRTKLELEWDIYSKIYQRDVNNYIIVDDKGGYKSKGCVKKRSPIDYDLPIITKAIIQYCVDGTPVEDTINNCEDLIEFQKIVKVSSLYKSAFYGTVKQITEGKSKFTVVDEGERLPEKVFRVFASKDENAKGIFKIKNEKKVEKIGNTPDKCFIWNEDVRGVKCPDYLDKDYYITMAKENLADFLGTNDKKKSAKKSNEEQLMEVLNKGHKTFYDVLVDIKLNTKVINTNLTKYIKIDVFKEYGKVTKLLRYMEVFKLFYNKKNMKKVNIDKVISSDSIHNVLIKYSDYNEDKGTYSKLDSEMILKDIFEIIPNDDISINEKVKQEFDLYDDLTIKDTSVDPNVLFVMNINDTKNPSIIAYNIHYGTTNILKVSKDLFKILEIRERDFIYAQQIERRPGVKVVGKDENGINILDENNDIHEWWITKYDIIERDYGKNNKLIIESEMEVSLYE